MSVTNLQLNVRANTARALRDFKAFSNSLDNKFLVSGLKLDVIRSALGQINREFQKSIGEQGLASASSLRAAQNQAAMLTQIFKGFSDEAAMSITTRIGTALNSVAARAGGTMKDVQKTLNIAPFLDRNIAESKKIEIASLALEFQKNFRRAGMGDNFGDIATQFLKGQTTGRDLVNSQTAIGTFLGAEIMKRTNGQGFIDTPERRTQLLNEILSDKAAQEQLKKMARYASGYRIVLEDLNSYLFNTERGVFGSLRRVVDRTGKTTTIFDEVEKLVQSVFGPGGAFDSFFGTIAKVFKVKDPLQILITLVQFITKLSNDLAKFFKGDTFKNIVENVKFVFDKLGEFFNNLRQNFSQFSFDKIFDVFKDFFEQIKTGNLDPSKTVEFIKEIGETVREYIKRIGAYIRGSNTDKPADFVTEIMGNLLIETGKTIGVLIKELFAVFIAKVPSIAEEVLPMLNKGINTLLTDMFGEVGGKLVKFIASFMPGPIGAIARASSITDLTGGVGTLGILGALAPFLLGGGGGISGAAGRLFTGMGRGPMALRALGGGLMGGGPLGAVLAAILPSLIGGFTGGRNAVRNVRGFQNRVTSSRFWPFGGGGSGSPPSGGGGRPGSGGFWPFGGGGSGSPPSGGGGRPGSGGFWPFGGGGGRPGSGGFWPFGGGGGRPGPGGFWPFGGRGGGPSSGGNGGFSPPGTGGYYSPPGWGRQRYNYNPGFRGMPGQTIDMSRSWTGSYYYPGDRPTSAWGRQRHNYNPGFRGLPPMTIDMSRDASGGFYYPEILNTTDDDFGYTAKRVDKETLTKRARRISGIRKRKKILRNLGRFAKGAGIAGLALGGLGLITGVFGGPGANATTMEFDPETGEMVPAIQEEAPRRGGIGTVLAGAGKGALEGASYGMMLGPKGAAAGAVIGGIIGGIAPLMDEGVKEGITQFVKDAGQLFNGILTTIGTGIGNGFTNFVNWLGEAFEGVKKTLQGAWNNITNGFTGLIKMGVNALIFALNAAISNILLLPRAIMGMVEWAFNILPGAKNIPGLGDAIEAGKTVTGFQIPYFYRGKNDLSTVMAREARMSGKQPIFTGSKVIHDGEFVIPSGGLPSLAASVGESLKRSSRENFGGSSRPMEVKVSLTLNVNSVVADPRELVNALRSPVEQIIDEAFKEAQQTTSPFLTYS